MPWQDYLAPFLIYFVLFGGLAALWFFRRSKKARATASDAFFRDLTAAAKNGEIDPVIGRDEEIERIIHIISRRTKNNPLLVGEPGVGKTAIVEGLAHRLAEGKVPEILLGKRLLELNLAELLSGTKYRGDFEQRLRGVIQTLEAEPRSTILFVDEIHLVEQTKGVEGALSASDVLKPALARGDLPVIGATTLAEYEKYIRAEPALDRRFQPVFVAEPSEETAIAVLRGVRPLYEEHHQVKIDDAALVAAVHLSRPLKTRQLPDKAIDLIDEACAKVAIEASDEHRVRFGLVHGAAKKARERFEGTRGELQKEAQRVRSARKDFREDPARAEADDVLKDHLQGRGIGRRSEAHRHVPSVTREDIAEVVNDWSALARKERKTTA